MTVEEIRNLPRECLGVRDVAEWLGCDPQRVRDFLDMEDEKPIEMRSVLFPHCKIGNRHRIPRDGFLRWVTGDLNPVTECLRTMGMGDSGAGIVPEKYERPEG